MLSIVCDTRRNSTGIRRMLRISIKGYGRKGIGILGGRVGSFSATSEAAFYNRRTPYNSGHGEIAYNNSTPS